MMADNNTRIVITAATDAAERGLKQVSTSLGELGGAAGIAQTALGALGGAVSLGGIAALAKQTIDAADSMKDLADQTQIPLAELAKYRLAADQSGTSIDKVARGVKSLSQFMVSNGEAMRDAGITARDADTAFRQLADIFKAMPEGIERAALANKLFGKAGEELLPMLIQGSQALEDAAEKTRKYGQAMADLAPKADEFNDNLAEIKINLEAAGADLFKPWMDGLVGLSKFFADAAAGGERLANVLEFVGERDGFARAVVQRQLDKSRIQPGSALISDEFRGRIGMASSAGGGIGTDTADSILAKIRANALIGGKSDTERAAAVKKEADGWKEFADAIKRAHDNALAWEESGQLIEKQALDHAKALNTLNEASETHALQMERDIENYGLTEGQIQRTIIARLEEARSLTDPAFAEHLAFLDREIEARKRLANAADSIDARKAQEEAKRAVEAAAEESRRQWERITDDINRSLTDAIMEGGKGGGKLLEEYFKTLILRPVIQMATQPIANAVGSVFGGGSGGGGFGGMPIPGGGSSLYSSFATSTLGQTLGLSESIAPFAWSEGASAAAAGAQLTSLGSTIGTALPYIGAAIAVGSLLMQDDGPAQRRGNFRSGLGLSTGVGPGDSNNAIDMTEWFSGSEMNASLNAFQKEIAAGEKRLIENLGLKSAQINAVDRALYAIGDRKYDFGTEHTDWRQSMADEQILADRLQVISDTLGISIKDLTDAMSDSAISAAERAEQIRQAEAEAKAKADEEAAKKAADLARQSRALDIELMQALGDTAGATAALRADALAALDETLRGKQQEVWAAQDAAEAIAKAQESAAAANRERMAQLEAEANAVLSLSERMRGFTLQLEDFRASLGMPGSTSGPSYSALRSRFSSTGLAAMLADEDALRALPGTVTDFLGASRQRAGSRLEFARDQAMAINVLDAAIGAGGRIALAGASGSNDAVQSELAALRAELRAANIAIATAQQETARILRRWEGGGMPETRVTA